VKDEKITVHAWLVDGEVVEASADRVLASFKSKIHRETTEKEANKAVIENVLEKVLGAPMKLMTCMDSGYKEVSSPIQSARGEDPDKEVDVVARAIEIFGEDLVEISTKGEWNK
jgi:DNA polymerase-3 subunit gamma/tau